MSQEKFSLLRGILKALGLSEEAINDIVERILDWLSDRDESTKQVEFPYLVRDDFLSPAEQSFYMVLKNAVSDWALVCPKVALGDLFYVKSNDASKYRGYTNKIDRKHVDFLLCDPKTVRPLLGIELDDKSHRRPDRQMRDTFVENVFATAKLPLARLDVQNAYNPAELNILLRQKLQLGTAPLSMPAMPSIEIKSQVASPCCPKCNSEMVVRVAKTGSNRGERFWGCPNYPRCRGVLKFEEQTSN